jgi:valyl-tRNA synthetase
LDGLFLGLSKVGRWWAISNDVGIPAVNPTGLDEMPAKIESLEKQQSELHKKMADPGFYQGANDAVANAKTELKSVESELENIYFRWEELEG